MTALLATPEHDTTAPMQIPGFANLVAKLGLPVLALRDRRHSDPAEIAAAQERWLRRLLGLLGRSAHGRALGLDRLPRRALRESFRLQVPVGDYASHADAIAQAGQGVPDVLFPGVPAAIAQTSGTTRSGGGHGERWIPQSTRLLDHHARGGGGALARLVRATGQRILDGRLLMLGGSTGLAPNGAGIPTGDLSGIIVSRIPGWLWPLYEPGAAIAGDPDWTRKLSRTAVRCAHADIRLCTGIPSWLLLLFEAVCAERGVAAVREAWPHLRGLIHGGHGVATVLPGLQRHLDPETRMLEVYAASEAFIAVGAATWRLGDGVPGPMEALSDHGVVLEFLPEGSDGAAAPGSEAVGPERLERGQRYRVLVTTPGGLVRYQVGDVVEGQGPGLLRFAGRVRTRISAFGEHVEASALAEALAAACAATGAEVRHFHVAPRCPAAGEPSGRHDWLVEFTRAPADAAAFTAAIDASVRRASIDYDAHRAGGQLQPPVLYAVPTGTFHRWLAARGALGGQHKVPEAWNDRTIAEALLAHSAAGREAP